jgi:hypothetical protein
MLDAFAVDNILDKGTVVWCKVFETGDIDLVDDK